MVRVLIPGIDPGFEGLPIKVIVVGLDYVEENLDKEICYAFRREPLVDCLQYQRVDVVGFDRVRVFLENSINIVIKASSIEASNSSKVSYRLDIFGRSAR